MLSVSVVICAHTERRWDDTLAAAASVRDQSYAVKELVVVVDHNRPLYERLKSALPETMVVENRELQGLSGGKNTGIAMATGEVVAFLDDDAVADVDWLKFMIDSYKERGVVGRRPDPCRVTPGGRRGFEEFDWVGCTYVGILGTRARA